MGWLNEKYVVALREYTPTHSTVDLSMESFYVTQ